MSETINMKKDIIILGAGLTGLTIGYYLRKRGKDFVIVEKKEKPGGVIGTVAENGFVYETGPNTGVLSTPEIVELFEELAPGCVVEKAGSGAGKRYILKNGKWTPLPSGLISAINTPLFSFSDKIRILGEPFRKPGTDENESLASLVIRRLGKSYLDYAVDPFISGIYAGDPHRLVTKYALPKLYALEQKYGSFIRGTIVKKTEPSDPAYKKVTKEVFSAEGGLGSLVTALTDAIGMENILTSCHDTRVVGESGTFTLDYSDAGNNPAKLTARTIISTVGAFELPHLFPFIPENLTDKIKVLDYAPVIQVSVGYRRWQGQKLDAFGGLIPSLEGRDVLGILFPSAIFRGRSPEGGALLSVFMGGIKKRHLLERTDEEIASIALGEIEKTLAARGEPELVKIRRYTHAIPQYEKGSDLRLKAISEAENLFPGLVLAGNIRDGIGMADRVRQGRAVAGSIL